MARSLLRFFSFVTCILTTLFSWLCLGESTETFGLCESVSKLVCPGEVSSCLRRRGAAANSRGMGASECNLMEQMLHPSTPQLPQGFVWCQPFPKWVFIMNLSVNWHIKIYVNITLRTYLKFTNARKLERGEKKPKLACHQSLPAVFHGEKTTDAD